MDSQIQEHSLKLEYLMEFSLTYVTGFGFQGTLNDTMLDFFLGLFGGLTAVILFEKIVN